MIKFVVSPLLLAAAVLGGVPAFADTMSRGVMTADLDLASPAGQATLRHRLAAAVTAVCGGYRGIGSADIEQNMAVAHCRAGAWKGAAVQVAMATDQAHRLAARDTGVMVASR